MELMNKLTAEPGYSWGKTGGQFGVCNENDALLVTTGAGDPEAIAARAAACISACADIPTYQLFGEGGEPTNLSSTIDSLRVQLADSRDNNRAAMGWLADCRMAVGDNGKRMLPDFVQHLKELAEQHQKAVGALSLCVSELRGWVRCHGEDLETIAAIKAASAVIESAKHGTKGGAA